MPPLPLFVLVLLYLLLPINRVILLLLPSISFKPLPLFELFLCSSLVTTANDDDNDDYANEYDLIPAVSLFIEF